MVYAKLVSPEVGYINNDVPQNQKAVASRAITSGRQSLAIVVVVLEKEARLQ